MIHYPQRSGEPDCRDFLRTGRCKYGDSCKYHHPIGGVKAPSDPNEPLFPIRPDEPPCQYYLKNGTCKFGQTCKFNHPPNIVSRSRSASLGALTAVNPSASNLSQCVQVPSEVNINGDIGLLLPQRPTEPECIYFLKHGRCKYGSTCKYHHPANVHTITDSNPSRYSTHNSPLYQVQRHGRERSISSGSVTEVIHEVQGQPIRGTIGSPYIQSVQLDHQKSRRVVDSVPQGLRHKALGTISNSYHLYPHQAIDPLLHKTSQRYFNQGTTNSGNASPKISSPSATSSTMASSYDTAVSGLEKLPPALVQPQNQGNIPGSINGSIHQTNNSSEDGFVGPGVQDAMNASSHETMRISNIHHYMQQMQVGNRYFPQQVMDDSFYEGNSRFSSEHSSNHSNSSLTTNQISNTDQNRRLPVASNGQHVIHRPVRDEYRTFEDYKECPAPRPRSSHSGRHRNVDDGLSMMTSALLTMLDAPGEQVNNNINSNDASSYAGFHDTSNGDFLNEQTQTLNSMSLPNLHTQTFTLDPSKSPTVKHIRSYGSGSNIQTHNGVSNGEYAQNQPTQTSHGGPAFMSQEGHLTFSHNHHQEMNTFDEGQQQLSDVSNPPLSQNSAQGNAQLWPMSNTTNGDNAVGSPAISTQFYFS